MTEKYKTLGYHLSMARKVFLADSDPVVFLEDKIAKSPKGEDELVLCSELQLVHMLLNLHFDSGDSDEQTKAE